MRDGRRAAVQWECEIGEASHSVPASEGSMVAPASAEVLQYPRCKPCSASRQPLHQHASSTTVQYLLD